jgi:hypothetical protein
VRNVLPGLGNRVSTTMALAGFGWESAGSKPSHTLLCMITTQFKIAPRVVTDDGDLDGWSAAATQGERELPMPSSYTAGRTSCRRIAGHTAPDPL